MVTPRSLCRAPRRRPRRAAFAAFAALAALAALVVGVVGVVLVAVTVALVGPATSSAAAGPAGPERAQPRAAQERPHRYTARLRAAVADLPTRSEHRAGYDRELFVHWIDADGDGCDTRDEVLIDEATRRATVGSGCSLRGGRWYSYYDAVTVSDPSDLDVDHLVPLAEAWDSGAWAWSSTNRRRYANDLADSRTLVAVTASTNRSKSDQDIREWQPGHQRCRYLREWVAVKHRWRLSVDGGEKRAMSSMARRCGNPRVSVVVAR